MTRVRRVTIAPQPLTAFKGAVPDKILEKARAFSEVFVERFKGRALWHINSTARGGGVAEMLQSLLRYARGVGVDVRWGVMSADSDFFRITKRIHNAIHGARGDGSRLDDADRASYERVAAANAIEFAAALRDGDVVVLHDPQTLGMARALSERGAKIIWRSHIGTDTQNEETELAWSFLRPYFRARRPLCLHSRSVCAARAAG